MPIIVEEGQFRFFIYTRENDFEPPHVHVVFGGEEVRIELVGGTFMEEPPPGKRRAKLDMFRRYASAIWTAWELLHSEGPEAEG